MPGSFSIATADADQYTILLAGVALSKGAGQTGYADGEFCTIKQKKKSFVSVEGTDGSVARGKTNSHLLDIGLMFLQTSSNNAVLSGLLALDENTPGGAGIGTFEVRDQQGTTVVLCEYAWITGPADIILDRTPTARKWEIEAIKSIMLVGGN
jgi:hypothetical protein